MLESLFTSRKARPCPEWSAQGSNVKSLAQRIPPDPRFGKGREGKEAGLFGGGVLYLPVQKVEDGLRGEGMRVVDRANARWSMDFMADTLASGRTLNVVDDFTRECLAIEVDTSLAERLRREFQREVPGRVPERALVREPGRCADDHRGVARDVQPPPAAQRVGVRDAGGVRRAPVGAAVASGSLRPRRHAGTGRRWTCKGRTLIIPGPKKGGRSASPRSAGGLGRAEQSARPAGPSKPVTPAGPPKPDATTHQR